MNRSLQLVLHKLFFAWVALGVFLPLQPSLYAQQVELRGTVAVHNSKYETGEVIYVQNAYLSAPFTVPATSDVEGVFVLEFVGLASGTALKIEAEKAGLEVVNTRELEEVVIGRKFPLRIYVAEKGKLAQAQTELYKISKQALFARRDALIARLRADTEESQAAMAELQAAQNGKEEVPEAPKTADAYVSVSA
jgi:hypothetical protein